MSAAETLYADPNLFVKEIAIATAYMMVICDLAKQARADVDLDLDRLESARQAADEARAEAQRKLSRCNELCEYAESLSRFVARAKAGDVQIEDLVRAATAITEMRDGGAS